MSSTNEKRKEDKKVNWTKKKIIEVKIFLYVWLKKKFEWAELLVNVHDTEQWD